jgi:hypothetical protein
VAQANLRWTADTAEAIAKTEALKKVVSSVGGPTTTGAIKRLGASWKVLVPAIAGAGVAVLGVTGNLSALAPIIPVLTIALTGLLAPFTTLAALVVGFIPPLTLLGGLLGGLAVAFGFAGARALKGGGQFAGFAKMVHELGKKFSGLTTALAHDFLPIFSKLAGAASDALGYLTKISHLSLKDAFKSLSTTGVAGFQKFLDMIGRMVAKPIRLAFAVAFGKSDTLRKALVDDWNDIVKFFTGKHGVLLPVEKWFGKQDFTATGYRWATELAGAMVKVLGTVIGKMLSSQGGKFILGGTGIGAAIGAALGGPIGFAMGAAMGAAIGIVLNHYWPKIKEAGIDAFHAVGEAVKKVLGATLWNEIISLAKSFWDTLKAVGGFLQHDVWPIVKKVWGALGGWHSVFVVVAGVIRIIVGALVLVAAAVRKVYNWAKKVWDAVSGAARAVAGKFADAWDTVKSAVKTVSRIVGDIVSAIDTAVGLAERLANALGVSSGTTTNGGGNPISRGGGLGRHNTGHAVGGVITRQIQIGRDVFGEPSTGGEAILPLKSAGGREALATAVTTALQRVGGGGQTSHLHVHLHGGTYIGTTSQRVAKDLAHLLQPELARIATRRA